MKKQMSFILLGLSVFVALFALAINTPNAYSAPEDTVMYSSTTVGGPTYNRTFADCSGLSSTGIGVAYHVQAFVVDTAGTYTFSSVQAAGWDGFLVLYSPTFDPNDAMTNCLSGDDDGAGGIGTSDFSYALTSSTPYILVTTGFDSTESGPFDNTISGPGIITLTGVMAPPEITVSPSALSANLYAGTTTGYTTTQQLAIGNIGEADLDWSILESNIMEPVPHAPDGALVARTTGSGNVPAGNDKGEFLNPMGGVEYIQDGSFEAGSPNAYWTEASTNFGTPLCTSACGFGSGTGPRTGSWWAWFGGIASYEEASMTQNVTIPVGITDLTFYFELPVCDSASDYLNLTIDGTVVWTVNGADAQCNTIGYTLETVDISAYADGNVHVVEFYSESFATNANVTNFMVDDVSISAPDACQADNLAWLSASPTSGTTVSNTQSTVDVTFDSTGLAVGVYTGTLSVDSNDPVSPRVGVPVTLTVGAPTDVALSTVGGGSTTPVALVTMVTVALIGVAGLVIARRSQRNQA